MKYKLCLQKIILNKKGRFSFEVNSIIGRDAKANWKKKLHKNYIKPTKLKNTEVKTKIRGSKSPIKNLLTRWKDSHGIKHSFPINESRPSVSKVTNPLLSRLVMWKIQFEIYSIFDTPLNNLLILSHQLIDRWSFSTGRHEPKQCHNVEYLSFR